MAEARSTEIRELEERRWQALTTSDTATLRELYADDLTYTHANAAVDTKASYLAAIDEGRVAYQSVERSDEQVRIFGDTAVVTGHAVMTGLAGDNVFRAASRYTAVWARVESGWTFVAWHSTPAA